MKERRLLAKGGAKYVMIKLSLALKPRAVVADAQFHDKKELFAYAAKSSFMNYSLNTGQVFDCLDERERLGSTGFGSGTAIPHGKVSGLTEPVGIFVRLDKPMAFDSVDSLPVDLIFCLLSPDQGGSMHLKALAEVSRLFRDEKSVAKLRGAAQSDAIYALLTGNEERNAA